MHCTSITLVLPLVEVAGLYIITTITMDVAPFTTDPFTTGPFTTRLVVKGSFIIIIMIVIIVFVIVFSQYFLGVYEEVDSETDMVAD